MPEPDLRALVFTSLVLINMGSFWSTVRSNLHWFARFCGPNRSLWILLGSVTAFLAIAVFWRPAQLLFILADCNWNDLALCGIPASSACFYWKRSSHCGFAAEAVMARQDCRGRLDCGLATGGSPPNQYRFIFINELPEEVLRIRISRSMPLESIHCHGRYSMRPFLESRRDGCVSGSLIWLLGWHR